MIVCVEVRNVYLQVVIVDFGNVCGYYVVMCNVDGVNDLIEDLNIDGDEDLDFLQWCQV